MLLKIAGCACIIFGACAYGYGTGLEYKRHIEQLEYLNRVIWQISGEISYTKAPLDEVFERTAKRVEEPYRNWLKALASAMGERGDKLFHTLWKEAAEEQLKGLLLTREEREELGNLGRQMSYLDIRMQEQALTWYGKRLEERRKTLLAGLEQKRRLAGCLGAAGGIFLAVILV